MAAGGAEQRDPRVAGESLAIASGDGKSLLGGKRNPSGSGGYSKETQIVSKNSTYSTRQSNITTGDGGGAIYGCRSVPGHEPCMRANNLSNGRAFEFASTTGTEGGAITVGAGTTNVNAVPFQTNAAGRVANLNADKVDGIEADQLRAVWAVVASGATLGRNNGATGVTGDGNGEYQVTFAKDVSQCAYQATIGHDDASDPPAGEIGVAQGSTVNNVKVVTRDSDGTRANREFHVERQLLAAADVRLGGPPAISRWPARRTNGGKTGCYCAHSQLPAPAPLFQSLAASLSCSHLGAFWGESYLPPRLL